MNGSPLQVMYRFAQCATPTPSDLERYIQIPYDLNTT
jgi:hypothetical protein